MCTYEKEITASFKIIGSFEEIVSEKIDNPVIKPISDFYKIDKNHDETSGSLKRFMKTSFLLVPRS